MAAGRAGALTAALYGCVRQRNPQQGACPAASPHQRLGIGIPRHETTKREELLAPPAIQGGEKCSLNGEGCVILCCEAISPDKNRTRSGAPGTAEPPEIRSKSLRRDRLCTGIALWATVQPG